MANLTNMQTHESDWRSDRSLAYAGFRFTFGLNIMMRGASSGSRSGRAAFVTCIHADAVQGRSGDGAGAPHSRSGERAFPYIESVVGLLILIGFQTRAALVVGGLLIAALTFGTMLRNDYTIAWLQLTYAIAFFLLLAFRSWNLISVDGMMGRLETTLGVRARL